jgi:Holliday junction resolvase
MSPDTKKGRDLEKRLATNINRRTVDSVRCIPCGYSGNSGFPLGDILITEPAGNHAIEVKNSSADTFRIKPGDVEQSINCANANTKSWIALKFSRRQLVCILVPQWCDGSHSIRDGITDFTPDTFNARVGPSGSLIFDKPSLDEWPSKRRGEKDYQVICEEIGVEYE